MQLGVELILALADFDITRVPKVFHKFLIDDEEVLQKRWDICNRCEFLTKNHRCLKCKCFMRLKTRMGKMKCPIDKWDRV